MRRAMILSGVVVAGLIAAVLVVRAGGCGKGGGSAEAGKGGGGVVVVDPDEVGRPPATPEEEPNDTATQAQELPPDRAVEGTLAEKPGGDRDWYRIEIKAPKQILTATVTGVAELDLVLEAFGTGGSGAAPAPARRSRAAAATHRPERLVRINNSKVGEGEVLVNLAPAPGTTYLLVREAKGQGSAGRYRISYALRAAEEGEEREPNWKAPLATPLALEGEAVGYLGWVRDDDWYRVDLSALAAGARIRVEFDGLDEVRANLSLRSAAGAVLQERWGGAGEGITLANLAAAEGQKELFVVVRSQYTFNVESRYSVRVASAVPPGLTEAEPNDKPAAATTVPLGSPIAGLLGDTHDRDLYAIKIEKAAVLRAQVTVPLNLDAALALVDETGATLWEVDAGGAREPEVLPAFLAKPPRVLLQVRAPKAGSVSSVAPYHLKVEALPEGGWEQEPNSSQAAATPWPAELAELRGFLHPKGDVDWYRVDAGGEKLTLQVEAPKLKLKLELLALDGSKLASATTDAAGKARLEAATAAGTAVLLKVEDAGAPNPRESYRLMREKP